MELEKTGKPDDTSMETNKHLHKQTDRSAYIESFYNKDVLFEEKMQQKKGDRVKQKAGKTQNLFTQRRRVKKAHW